MDGGPPEQRPSQQRWAQVRTLLERALDVVPAERAAFVAREAGSDAALRAEVEVLLAGEGEPALEAPEGWPSGSAADQEILPQRAGPWRLLRRIGAGGMGEVYLGARADGQFKRRVAVKLVKLGMDTAEVLRRFEREREVLAALDHPGIARLLDGGVAPDGRPYLVLEYVEGEPLDRWCDHQRLRVRERVALFAEVCDAVEVAHRAQVVHRDLKPGNVLVDTEGLPKLLDFGIAKVLSGDSGPATVDLTDTPLRMLTPAYASPEQVRGGPITPASDVYSLGAMLFELLAGRRPLELQALSPLEIERTLCEREPVRPSQAVTEHAAAEEVAARRGTNPRGLRRELEGDLDTIVLEALRKEPRRRYATAADLAADLRRHLEGRPVRARPDTLVYRASKFVRRNALAVGSAALVVVALVGGLSVSLWQRGRARTANLRLAEQAVLDRERSRELERLTEELRAQSELAEAARAEAEQQSERAERRYHDLRDIARQGIFDVHRALVQVPGVTEARRSVVELGVHLLEGLASEGDDDPLLRREMVGGLLRLADEQGASASAGTIGQEAGELLERAVELAEGLWAEAPDEPGNRFTLGQALLKRGERSHLRGRTGAAIADWERAVEVCGGLHGPLATLPGIDYVRATALGRLAECDSELGRFESGEERIARAQELYEAVARREPGMRSDLAGPRFVRARLASARGDLTGAIDASLEGLELLEDALAATPENALLTLDLCAQLLALGHLFLVAEDIAAAEEVGARAGELIERLGRAAGREVQVALELSSAIAAARHDWEAVRRAALAWLEHALRYRSGPPEHARAGLDPARARLQLALAEARLGRPLEAEELLRACLADLAELPHDEDVDPFVARVEALARERLGELYEELARGEADAARGRAWTRRAREAYAESHALLEASSRRAPALTDLSRASARMAAAVERCKAGLADDA